MKIVLIEALLGLYKKSPLTLKLQDMVRHFVQILYLRVNI